MEIIPGLDPNTLSVDEKVDLVIESDGLLIDLLDCRVDGALYLSDLDCLSYLPENFCVEGDLHLNNCKNLYRLPDKFYVGGSLFLNNCVNLTEFPSSLWVEFNLVLSGCGNLRELPFDLWVGCNLYFDNSGIKSVPDGAFVYGEVYGDFS